jgi:hypothetical protein
MGQLRWCGASPKLHEISDSNFWRRVFAALLLLSFGPFRVSHSFLEALACSNRKGRSWNALPQVILIYNTRVHNVSGYPSHSFFSSLF